MLISQKIQLISLIPAWISVVLIGFVAYGSPEAMKFFLAMNLLVLAFTMIVLGSWISSKLKNSDSTDIDR